MSDSKLQQEITGVLPKISSFLEDNFWWSDDLNFKRQFFYTKQHNFPRCTLFIAAFEVINSGKTFIAWLSIIFLGADFSHVYLSVFPHLQVSPNLRNYVFRNHNLTCFRHFLSPFQPLLLHCNSVFVFSSWNWEIFSLLLLRWTYPEMHSKRLLKDTIIQKYVNRNSLLKVHEWALFGLFTYEAASIISSQTLTQRYTSCRILSIYWWSIIAIFIRFD